MSMERNLKRDLRGVSFATTIALVMTLTTLVSFSPKVSATPNTLRLLTTNEATMASQIYSVVAADLDGDGTTEVVAGGFDLAINGGYLAVFHFGGCCKTLKLLDHKSWLPPPNTESLVYSVAYGDVDSTTPGLEIVTAGYTRDSGGYYRGQLGLWKWDGATQTLSQLGAFKQWPNSNDHGNTYVYSVFGANVDSDPKVEVVTAGSYTRSGQTSPQRELFVWSWSSGSFGTAEATMRTSTEAPSAWRAVSIGNVDDDSSNMQEIATVGYGTSGGRTIGLIQLWHHSGRALSSWGSATWNQPAPANTITNGTFVGVLQTGTNNVKVLTTGYANIGGVDQQELNVFDYVSGSVVRQANTPWSAPNSIFTRGLGVYASDVDTDGTIEEISVGFSKIGSPPVMNAYLSIWSWDGSSSLQPVTWTAWVDSFLYARADATFVSNADNDLDGIREIITGGMVAPAPPTKIGQMRVWDWNLPITNQWTQISTPPHPSGRAEYSMTYDSTARVALLFGGYNYDTAQFFKDTWEYNAGTHYWAQLADGPSERKESAMAFDTKWDRTILFSGRDSTQVITTDTWQFSYGHPGTWTRILPAGDIPPAAYSSRMVYDENRGIAFLWGGIYDAGGYQTDMYEFYKDVNGVDRWEKVILSDPTVPQGRMEFAMEYDCKRDRIVLFGGLGDTGPLPGTWEYNIAEKKWELMYPAHEPDARMWGAMEYDSQAELVILFGGQSHPPSQPWTNLRDTWTYDGSDWTEITASSSPLARHEMEMVYDIHANRGIMFGGFGDTIHAMADTWEYRYS